MLNFIKTETPITICDIGAKSGVGNDVDNTFFIDNLINNTNCNLYGFEPNKKEFDKLISTINKKYFNYGIGNGTEEILNIYKAPGMCSILEPNLEYLDLFENFREWCEIIEKIKIKTKKLDEVPFNSKIDFIKIDVQGYESEIIRFGKNTLKECLVINVEVSPIPLYKKEKNFSYIYNQLTELGFVLHAFNRIETRCFKPITMPNHSLTGINHLLQLDCVFIKNFEEIKKYSSESLKKLAMILFFSFNSYDLVDFIIQKISNSESNNYIDKYREIVKNLKINKIY